MTSTSPSTALAVSDTAARPATRSGQPLADVDGDPAGALEQRLGGAGDDEPAGVDHHDVVADLLHVVEQVGGHEHGDPERAEAGDEGEHLLPAERVEAGGRLVEEDQLGVSDERLGELGALAHAGGEATDRAEARLVEADEVEDVRRPLARRPRRDAAQLTERGDGVGRRLIERQAVVLGHVAEAGTYADRVAGDVLTTDLDRALGRCGEAEEQPEHGRLAGAVGADQPDPTARHLEREAVERRHARVALGQAVESEERYHGVAIMPVDVP